MSSLRVVTALIISFLRYYSIIFFYASSSSTLYSSAVNVLKLVGLNNGHLLDSLPKATLLVAFALSICTIYELDLVIPNCSNYESDLLFDGA